MKDFFISYNEADRDWAEWIAWLLEEAGYSVVIQVWDFRPGGNFVLEMQKAIIETSKTIIVLSENYLNSSYTQPEWAAAFSADPKSQFQKLIPIRVEPCEPPGLLSTIIYADLVGVSEQDAPSIILDVLNPRAKPPRSPKFPGSNKNQHPVPYPGTRNTITGINARLTRDSQPFEESKAKTSKKVSIIENKRDQIIQGLEARYLDRYDQKLDERLALNLRLRYTEEGTTRQHTLRYFAKDTKDLLKSQAELAEVLTKHRYLLIIGEPGAGKTTILLDLALFLLSEAKNDKSLPIPMILNLASWRDKDADFGQWFEDILVQGNNFSRRLARKLIKTRQVLPLLDGFDEIGRSVKDAAECESLRSACLAAINKFMSNYEPDHLIICSRVDEYKLTVMDAPVKAELSVEPLGVSQIKQNLNMVVADSSQPTTHPFANMTTAQNMLYWMEINPAFTRLLKTPFYFNLASQTLYHQNTSEVLPLEETSLPKYMLEKFIETKLNQFPNRRFPSAEENKHRLSWLAKVLRQRNEVVFEFSTLQPSILSKPKQYSFIYNWIFGLIIAFCFYSTIFLSVSFFGKDIDVTTVIALVAIFGFTAILIGLIVGLFGRYFNWGQTTEDIRQWNLSNALTKQAWTNIVKFSLNAIGRGAKYGLIFGSFSGLIASLSKQQFDPLFISIVGGALIGSLGGLCYGLITGFFNEIRSKDFSETRSPLQKLRRGLIFTPFKWMLILSSASFVFAYFLLPEKAPAGNPPGIFIVILIFGILGLIIGFLLTSFFKHFILRYCLFIEGSIPLRYEAFLNYATKLRILERDSGTWRFRHQILQDYFADKTPQSSS